MAECSLNDTRCQTRCQRGAGGESFKMTLWRKKMLFLNSFERACCNFCYFLQCCTQTSFSTVHTDDRPADACYVSFIDISSTKKQKEFRLRIFFFCSLTLLNGFRHCNSKFCWCWMAFDCMSQLPVCSFRARLVDASAELFFLYFLFFCSSIAKFKVCKNLSQRAIMHLLKESVDMN